MWESRGLGLSRLSRGPLPHCGVALRLGIGVRQISQRAPPPPPCPFASFLLRLALAFQPAAGASHSPHGPCSEGARLQRRLPMSRGGEIARRPQERNPAGKPEASTARLLLPGICCQSRLQKWSGKNPEVIPSAAHSRKGIVSAPHQGCEPTCTIRN